MKDHEFKFYYPRLIQFGKSGKVFVTREYLDRQNALARTIDNRIYIFGVNAFERGTTFALNHEMIHVVLSDLIGEVASFTFDFIFKKEFLPIIRKLLGKKLGFIIGVYH